MRRRIQVRSEEVRDPRSEIPPRHLSGQISTPLKLVRSSASSAIERAKNLRHRVAAFKRNALPELKQLITSSPDVALAEGLEREREAERRLLS